MRIRLAVLPLLAVSGLALAFDPSAIIGQKFLLQNFMKASIKGVGKQSICAPLELTIESATTCHVDLLAVDNQGGYYYPGTPIVATVPCSWAPLESNKASVDMDNAALSKALEAFASTLHGKSGETIQTVTVGSDTSLVWPRADMVRSPFWMRATATLDLNSAAGTVQRSVKLVLGKKATKLPAEGTAYDWSTPQYLHCPSGSGYSDKGGYGGGN